MFSNVYGILGKTEKAEELIERFRKNEIYNRYQSMQEKLLVAGSLQDRKRSWKMIHFVGAGPEPKI